MSGDRLDSHHSISKKDMAVRFFVPFSLSMANLLIAYNLAPLLLDNISRGYYDPFSFIFVLCGHNPDTSGLHLLNFKQYDSFLTLFVWPGVIVGWVAFFVAYKEISSQIARVVYSLLHDK